MGFSHCVPKLLKFLHIPPLSPTFFIIGLFFMTDTVVKAPLAIL